MTNPMCIHGKAVFERCLPCEEGLKRGEHGGFVRAEQRPSKELAINKSWQELATEAQREREELRAQLGGALNEIEILRRQCEDWKQLHDNDEACIAALRSTHEPPADCEAEATRDMLTDARLELDALRSALGVDYEPHQSLHERMLDAANHKRVERGIQGPCPNCGAKWASVELSSSQPPAPEYTQAALVPVHPREGLLWANAIKTADADHPTSYPLVPVYVRTGTTKSEGCE